MCDATQLENHLGRTKGQRSKKKNYLLTQQASTIFLTKRVSMWKERICKNVQYMVLYKVAKPLQKEKNVITVIHNRSAEQTIYKNESVQLMR